MDKAKIWLLKDHNDKLIGSFSKMEILIKIKTSEFIGSETISLDKGKNWAEISSEVDFARALKISSRNIYEREFTQLNKEKKLSHVSKNLPTLPQNSDNIFDFDSIPEKLVNNEPTLIPEQPVKNESTPLPKQSATQETTDTQTNKNNNFSLFKLSIKNIKNLKQTIHGLVLIPIFLVASICFNASEFIYKPDMVTPDTDKNMSFLYDLTSLEKKGRAHFNKSTFKDYLLAQNYFNKILEKDINYKNIPTLLCMTHLQLAQSYLRKPFVKINHYQFTEKLKSLSKNLNSINCSATYSYINNDMKKSLSIINNFLNNKENKDIPPVYSLYLKSKILFSTKKIEESKDIVRLISQLDPDWLEIASLDEDLERNRNYNISSNKSNSNIQRSLNKNINVKVKHSIDYRSKAALNKFVKPTTVLPEKVVGNELIPQPIKPIKLIKPILIGKQKKTAVNVVKSNSTITKSKNERQTKPLYKITTKELQPQSTHSTHDLVIRYIEKKQYSQALSYLNKYKSNEPNAGFVHSEGFYNLLSNYKFCKSAINLRIKNSINSKYYLIESKCFRRARKLNLALKSLLKAESLNPKSQDISRELGSLYLKNSNKYQAIRQYKKYLRKNPYAVDANQIGLKILSLSR